MLLILTGCKFAGDIPLGYAARAKEVMESTHLIPVRAQNAETDASEIYRNLLQFLLPDVWILFVRGDKA
jgi:hypothetical protein